jgi:hypothetical protein
MTIPLHPKHPLYISRYPRASTTPFYPYYPFTHDLYPGGAHHLLRLCCSSYLLSSLYIPSPSLLFVFMFIIRLPIWTLILRIALHLHYTTYTFRLLALLVEIKYLLETVGRLWGGFARAVLFMVSFCAWHRTPRILSFITRECIHRIVRKHESPRSFQEISSPAYGRPLERRGTTGRQHENHLPICL